MDGHTSRKNCLLRQVTGEQIEGRSEWKTKEKTSTSMDDIGR